MNEEEARDWLAASVSRETFVRLEKFVSLLLAESQQQNLIASSTTATLWARHIVDSAQLLRFIDPRVRTLIDLGSGAGFPGLIIAALSDLHVTLVDSRKKRVAFLAEAVDLLGLKPRVALHCSRVERVPEEKFDAVSARAFAPLGDLLQIACRFAHRDTIWLLPKGRSAASELEAVGGSWQGAFRIEPSITDPEAAIIVAAQVKPRGNR